MHSLFKNTVPWLNNIKSVKQIEFIYIDIFLFYTFKKPLYSQKIRNIFASSSFLTLYKYYITKYFIKKINLNLFYYRIELLFFLKTDDIIFLK